MKKLILFAFAIMTMAATAQNQKDLTKPDPSGQDRYDLVVGTKAPLSIFESKAYDYSTDFFDGFGKTTAEKAGIAGKKAWDEFGATAKLIIVDKDAIIWFENGSQWTECYLEGCTKNGKPYFNRLQVIGRKIVETTVTEVEKTVAVAGKNGTNGINCWDLNQNGINDPNEDVNGDGYFNVLDCRGPQGPAGPQGPQGIAGLSAPQFPQTQWVPVPQQGYYQPQQPYYPQAANCCGQQTVYYNQQNKGYYWLEGAKLVLGTAIQFAQIFGNRNPQVVTVNNENVIYNHITTHQTTASNPVATLPPVNTPSIPVKPNCPGATWHTYADGSGEWKCPGYDNPGTNNPGPGTTNPGPGTNNPGPGTNNPGTGTTNGPGTNNPGPGTNDPGGFTKVNQNSSQRSANVGNYGQNNGIQYSNVKPAGNYSNVQQFQSLNPAPAAKTLNTGYQYNGNQYQLRKPR